MALRFRAAAVAALLVTLLPSKMTAQLPALPGPDIPSGIGVNIHFTDPRAGEMQELAAAGFRWVRMDFSWDGIERQTGRYDFSAYDRLMAALKPHHIRAYFILDYSNRHYDNGQSPHSEEARKAMARWAAAAATHFRGQGILWEMYNEPNIGFWRPTPNVDDYIKMALEVGRAIRAAQPRETYIGPATSGMDYKFLEACFKAGLLNYWSAVSVHPYRQSDPETASADYRRLRLMIDQYAPKGKRIPIISGEWGYSAAWGGFDEVRQGKMISRELLTNLMNGVPVSIWYDWHDDGADPREPEHHFGTVRFPYREGGNPVYEAKPAYHAAQSLTQTLAGFRFNKRLMMDRPDDYALLFSKGSEVRLAVWTTSRDPHSISIPASEGNFSLVANTGGARGFARAQNGIVSISATGAPVYVIPEGANAVLSVAAAWAQAPAEILVKAQREITVPLALRNPLTQDLRILAGNPLGVTGSYTVDRVLPPFETVTIITRVPIQRSAEPTPVRLQLNLPGLGAKLVQETAVAVADPLKVTLLPATPTALPIQIENPSGEAFDGVLQLTDPKGFRPGARIETLRFAAGMRSKSIRYPISALRPDYQTGVTIADIALNPLLTVPPASYHVFDDMSRYPQGKVPYGYHVIADGDPKVASDQSIVAAAPTEGTPPGPGALKIDYRFDPGWKFIRITPQTDHTRSIDGQPATFGIWVYGDGQGNLARLRFTDSTGQTFQPDGGRIGFRGWRWLTFPMDGSQAGHWGGADDGAIHYPIHFDSVLLVDSANRRATRGTLYITAPMLIYAVPSVSQP